MHLKAKQHKRILQIMQEQPDKMRRSREVGNRYILEFGHSIQIGTRIGDLERNNYITKFTYLKSGHPDNFGTFYSLSGTGRVVGVIPICPNRYYKPKSKKTRAESEIKKECKDLNNTLIDYTPPITPVRKSLLHKIKDSFYSLTNK